jgi:predicted aconitase with swiveling domain
MKHGVTPAAIIVREIEPVLAASVLIADIPTVEVTEDVLRLIKTGDFMKVDAQKGYVEVVEKAKEDF